MSNRSKSKGTSFESSLVPLLKEYYPFAERRTLSGAADKGDFVLPGAQYSLEAKNEKSIQLAGWLKEAQTEAKNLGVPHGVVVHKRKGFTDPRRQYVTLELGDFLDLLHGK